MQTSIQNGSQGISAHSNATASHSDTDNSISENKSHFYTAISNDVPIPYRQMWFGQFGTYPSQKAISDVPFSEIQDWAKTKNLQLHIANEQVVKNEVHINAALYTQPHGPWLVLEKDNTHTANSYTAIILYSQADNAKAQQWQTELNALTKQQQQTPTFYVITKQQEEYSLLPVRLAPVVIEPSLYYTETFAEDYPNLVAKLSDAQGKGLVVLHGLPGTGKTMLVRHLISVVPDKKFIFLPPEMMMELAAPRFISFLQQHTGAVLVIEEGELALRARQAWGQAAVNNLLNLTDGLLSDYTRIQVVVTLNGDYTSIDKALLRKGRLIGRYAFEKLSIAQSQKLATHLGKEIEVTEPMTLAEIFNTETPKGAVVNRRKVGF